MHTLSGLELHKKFIAGELSAVQIINHFLERINKYDPQIGAFLTVFNEDALKKAEELDKRLANGEKLGPMAAIPVAIKDNIQIKNKITTCASKFLTNYLAPFSATVVQRLQNADAIIIGKTNLDEFAMGSSNEHSALKQTNNPWDLNCVPGGSSGGSAAAVAGRLCPISLGSDTGGSVRQPAAFCGVNGYKPTYGRVSRYGLVAFASSLDQIGPLANYIEDIALTLETITGGCDHDSTSIPKPPEKILDLLETDIKGVKIGIPYHSLETLQPNIRKNFDDALKVLEDKGAILMDINLDLLKYSIAVYHILSPAEASTNLARFDGIRYGNRSKEAQTLDEIYSFSKEEGFGAEVKRRILLGTYVLSAGFQNNYYKQAQKVRTMMIHQFESAFKGCDIIAMPTTPSPAFELGAVQDPLEMYLADIYTISSNLVGSPAISVPSGFTENNKPLGLQFIGPQQSDAFVCKIANSYEQATKYNLEIPTTVK